MATKRASRFRLDVVGPRLFYLGWVATLVALVSRHAPWRDEFQAWLVATRPPLSQLFEAIRYERQPPLYYMVLRAWDRLLDAIPGFRAHVFSDGSLLNFQIPAVLAISGAVYLWMFGLRVRGPLRYLVPLGCAFLLEYGMIARTYGLGVFLLLAAVAALQRERFRLAGPLLVLAGGCQLYLTLMAGALWLLAIGDQPRRWLDTTRDRAINALVGLGFLLTVVLQWPPADSTFSNDLSLDAGLLQRALIGLWHGLTGLDAFTGGFRWNAQDYGSPLWMALPLLVLLGLKLTRFPVGLWLLVVAVPWLLMATVAHTSSRHLELLGIALLAVGAWRQPRFGTNPVAVSVALVSIFASARWIGQWQPWLATPAWAHSGAGDLVRAVREDFARDRGLLVAFKPFRYFGVVAMLETEILDARSGKVLRYPDFRFATSKLDLAGVCAAWQVARADAATPHARRLYFDLSNARDAIPPACGKLEVVFATRGRVQTDEAFVLARSDLWVVNPLPRP